MWNCVAITLGRWPLKVSAGHLFNPWMMYRSIWFHRLLPLILLCGNKNCINLLHCVRKIKGPKYLWMKMSVCALASIRLSWAPFMFAFEMNFQTLPTSYDLIFDFVLLIRQVLKYPTTKNGSMKILICCGREQQEPGACVIFHSHYFKSHISPFHATRTTVSDMLTSR